MLERSRIALRRTTEAEVKTSRLTQREDLTLERGDDAQSPLLCLSVCVIYLDAAMLGPDVDNFTQNTSRDACGAEHLHKHYENVRDPRENEMKSSQGSRGAAAKGAIRALIARPLCVA